MSRTCTLSTSNYMYVGNSATVDQLAVPMAAAPACSIHCFIQQRAAQTNQAAIYAGWNQGTVAGYMNMAIPTSGLIFVNGRSHWTETFFLTNATTRILPGQWFAVGGINNFTTVRQSIYVNGKHEKTSAVTTWANATYQNGISGGLAAQIGTGIALPPANTTTHFDGLISDLAIWKVALNDSEMAALGRGTNPLLIRSASLLLYVPLVGRASPETNLGSLGSTGNCTITGTMLEGPPPPAFIDPMLSPLETDAITAAIFRAAWARGANLPVLGTGTF